MIVCMVKQFKRNLIQTVNVITNTRMYYFTKIDG